MKIIIRLISIVAVSVIAIFACAGQQEAGNQLLVDDLPVVDDPCPYALPIREPRGLLEWTTSVLVVEYRDTLPDRLTQVHAGSVGASSSGMDGDGTYDFAEIVNFDVVKVLYGEPLREVRLRQKAGVVDGEGNIVVKSRPCAPADFTSARFGDRFVVFVSWSASRPDLLALAAADAVASVTGTIVTDVGAAPVRLSDDEKVAHPLASWIGVDIDDLDLS